MSTVLQHDPAGAAAAALPDIAVVIPVRNDPGHLEACLNSLRECNSVAYEIVVVDDASTDATPQVGSKLGARVIRIPECRGPAAARNRGVAEAVAPLVLFIDADVCVHSDTLARLVQR